MKIEITPFDAAEYLDTPEMQEEILKDAIESGDAKYIAHVLGVVSKARAMHGNIEMPLLTQEINTTGSALDKALNQDDNPSLLTFLGVLQEFGFKLKLERV